VAKKKKFTYEDRFEEVDNEIRKRRGKWRLTSLAWIDFDDVSQIIRTHLYNKWDQWDQSRPLLPWINKIITNQLKNILRNYYHNFVKPCANCPFNQSQADTGELCGFTKSGVQDNSCPLFAKWGKSKKHAYDVKMPVPIENIPVQMGCMASENIDLDGAIKKIDKILEESLTPKQYNVFKMLFLEKMTEEEVAISLGYRTSEKGRKAGYKQIKNLKKMFRDKITKILDRNDIFYKWN
jgi:RNA polymerase sigma factor (sigma-70 family)